MLSSLIGVLDLNVGRLRKGAPPSPPSKGVIPAYGIHHRQAVMRGGASLLRAKSIWRFWNIVVERLRKESTSLRLEKQCLLFIVRR